MQILALKPLEAILKSMNPISKGELNFIIGQSLNYVRLVDAMCVHV